MTGRNDARVTMTSLAAHQPLGRPICGEAPNLLSLDNSRARYHHHAASPNAWRALMASQCLRMITEDSLTRVSNETPPNA